MFSISIWVDSKIASQPLSHMTLIEMSVSNVKVGKMFAFLAPSDRIFYAHVWYASGDYWMAIWVEYTKWACYQFLACHWSVQHKEIADDSWICNIIYVWWERRCSICCCVVTTICWMVGNGMTCFWVTGKMFILLFILFKNRILLSDPITYLRWWLLPYWWMVRATFTIWVCALLTPTNPCPPAVTLPEQATKLSQTPYLCLPLPPTNHYPPTSSQPIFANDFQPKSVPYLPLPLFTSRQPPSHRMAPEPHSIPAAIKH